MPVEFLIPSEQIGTPIDIHVPTYTPNNSAVASKIKMTMNCIDAIFENTQAPFHLIITDYSDDELTRTYFKMLKRQHKDKVTILHGGPSAKCGNQFFNWALKHCRTDYMATVMNSILVEPDWEIAALDLMKKDPQIGVIGMKCLFPWGRIESAGIAMLQYMPVDVGKDLAGHRLTSIYECQAVQWAFALLRKQAILGNLDETIFHGHRGWDDIDNCFALKAKGWKIFYCGYGVGYHYPRSTRGSNDPESAHQNAENAQAFYKRWGYWAQFKRDNPHALDIPNPKWQLIKDFSK